MCGMAVAVAHYRIVLISGLIRPFVEPNTETERMQTIFIFWFCCAEHTTHAADGVVRVLGRRDLLLASEWAFRRLEQQREGSFANSDKSALAIGGRISASAGRGTMWAAFHVNSGMDSR
jgi:hypothetical protein